MNSLIKQSTNNKSGFIIIGLLVLLIIICVLASFGLLDQVVQFILKIITLIFQTIQTVIESVSRK